MILNKLANASADVLQLGNIYHCKVFVDKPGSFVRIVSSYLGIEN